VVVVGGGDGGGGDDDGGGGKGGDHVGVGGAGGGGGGRHVIVVMAVEDPGACERASVRKQMKRAFTSNPGLPWRGSLHSRTCSRCTRTCRRRNDQSWKCSHCAAASSCLQ
jgi:hypothetical protein